MARTLTLLAARDERLRARTVRRALVVLWMVVVPCWGCASPQWVTLRESPRNPLAGPLQLLSWGGPKPTTRTMQLLRRYDLADDLQGDPETLLSKFGEVADREPAADKVYALAELAYLGGAKTAPSDDGRALDLYGAAVMHASRYLFDPRFGPTRNPYDPQFRGASELYNTALESALRIGQKRGLLEPGTSHTLETAGKQLEVTCMVSGTAWRPEDFKRFEFVSDYKLIGLKNHYQTHGLGVPLIAVRKNMPAANSAEQFYPPNLSFPVTAFLRIVGNHPPARPGEPARIQAVLELCDPLASPEVEEQHRLVPLESDLSTPLAFFLSQPQFDDKRLSTTGLLNPEVAQGLAGIYMLDPYHPDKIPVVMVHGLWSSPVTWMEMFNDLRSERQIRDHFQFWFYLYPTGQPFWNSAKQMREDLAQLRSAVDPYRQQPALDQMVLVGHSMGGLVSKLQTVSSGNHFWEIVSDKPFQLVKAEPPVRDTLAQTFFYEPNPSIRRIVTIGTPHGGSEFANDATRWLGRKLINLPKRLLVGRQRLVEDNPDYFRETTLLAIDTSIDSLAPDSPFLPVLRSIPPAPWVKHHNIVGQVPKDGFLGKVSATGDGVVALTSARMDQAASQIVVPADHSNVHRHPRSVLEVRRILLEHLAEIQFERSQQLPRDRTAMPPAVRPY